MYKLSWLDQGGKVIEVVGTMSSVIDVYFRVLGLQILQAKFGLDMFDYNFENMATITDAEGVVVIASQFIELVQVM